MANEAHEPSGTGADDIFAMFEPPPEVDPNKFGPVPIVNADLADGLVAGGLVAGSTSVDDVLDIDSAERDARAGALSASPSSGIHPDEFIGFAPRLEPVAVGSVGPDEPTAAPRPNADLTSLTGTDALASEVGLPHWTEPATGQVPRVVAPDNDGWIELAGPRWKGEGPDWADDDIASVFGASGLTTDAGLSDLGVSDLGFPDGLPSEDPVIIDDEGNLHGLIPPGAGAPQRPQVRPRPRVEAVPSGERNIPQAIMVGIVLAAVALMAFRLGNLYALGLIAVAALFGSVELFDTMRRAGVHPATLLGVVASVGFPLAVYWKGQQAFPLMVGLVVVFGALWYLSGADTHRPALNLGLTFLGVSWVGCMAAFGAMLLNLPDGRSTIVAAIVVTVASDTAALAGGKAFGGHSFHPASPSKTWEGTIVGFVAAVVAGVVMGVYGVSPFSDNLIHAALLGVVGGVLAPLGDLTESMVKRDLGVKDMGRLLPGHGGVLDRVDGLLFVLPGIYYLTLILGLDQLVATAGL
ncbi:MAG: phosphatidate cytidylyltransferase [Actinomycetota bacterium]|nr:phosphatidate cytidylyltransferase [Actinomycetota bacterium]